MKSKRLLSLMLLCFAVFGVARAQETLTVHDGTATSGYVPVYGFYADAYLKCEMVYPAAELEDMDGGTITSMTFYATTPASDSWGNANFQVFLTEVADATISAYVGPGTIVYEGALDGTQSEMTITFTTPYVYNGGNLLVGVYNTVSGSYKSITWAGEEVTGASITGYSYSSLDAVAVGQRNFLPKTTFGYTPGEVVGCGKPKQLAVNYTGGTSATVTWTGDATLYNIDVNGTVTNNVTSPYTLSGLDLATTYTVKVQANCDGDLSDFTNAVSFTTDLCMPENQCNLTFVLTDTYGDSWNGNAIVVKDVATGVVVGTLANQNLDGVNGEETQTVTLAVCDGRELEFSWVAGSYPGETQYTVTDINNEVILEGSGAFETFTFTPSCTPVTCARPENVVVTYTGGDTAEVSWEAHAESYNIDVNGTVIEGITDTEYELTGLELATTYSVMVQANCGADGLSNWTNAVSFMTDLCMPEDMCQISLALVDSYGDGWNGASIDVYDFDTISENLTLLSTFTLESGTSSGDFTLNVCDGRFLVFFWTAGNYDSECSYTVYDNLGDPIFSGSDAMEDYETFFMNCSSTCRMPIEFAASEIGGHSVMLNWTEQGEATSWTLAYMSENDTVVSYVENITTKPYMLEGLTPLTKYYAMVTANCEDQQKWSDMISWTTAAACPKPHITVDAVPTSALVSWTGFADEYEFEWAEVPATESKDPYNDENWYYYDNGTYVGSVGLGGGEFHWGVMFPAGTYEGTLVSKVKAYDINAMVGTLAIYNDGDAAPANQISIQDVEFTGAGDWVEFTTNAIIDPTKNVWVVFDAVDGAAYPIGTSNDDNGDANGRWVEINGTWYDMANVGVTGRANMLRAYIEAGVDPNELDWQSVPGATSPVTLADLNPETQYVVRIKALCGGEDGESEWATYFFWTPSACATPINLEAEVEATSATLSWSDYQESYNVRYRRTPYVATTYFSENFDEGLPTTWTTIDNDTTTVGNWIALSEINSVYTYYTSPLTGWAHSGADAVASASFVNGVGSVATDNYLVTPQVTFNGKLRFYATSEYEDPDTYEVLLSTTGNSISDFNVTLQAMGPATYGAWDEVIIDLSDYAGQQGYIAIHHVATDKYWLVIDDFGMYDFVDEDWTDVTTTENTYTATGLTPESEYEWQVQGVNTSCDGGLTEWTEIQSFTTLELTGQTIALVQGINYFSTSYEITLNDLKAALMEAVPNTAITIQSQNQSASYNPNNHRWTGRLNTLDLTSMYIITVESACEITLTGTPIDLSTFSATINANGATYLAFPFNESMTLTDAFAGFAYNQDVVQSQTLNAKYNRGRWQGQLSTLDPGKGYIYQSAYSEPRTFTYPTGTSKVAQSSEKPMVTALSKQVQNITKETTLMPKAQKSFIKSNHKFDITK